MARPSAEHAVDVAKRLRASNRRVAWTLASIAAVFFAGIIATRWVDGGAVGIGVMGAVVLLFLVVAIGRNLRQTDERVEEGVARNDASTRDRAYSDARQADVSKAPREAAR